MNLSTSSSSAWLQRDGKIAKTIGYYAIFIALGLTAASLGPTLNGLAKNTGSTLSQISYLFLLRSFGYLLGSILAGRLYDRQAGHPIMVAALGGSMIMLIVAPLVSSLAILTLVMLLIGVSEGLIDVGGNTLLVWIHSPNIGPYMNALHFFFGVGAVFSPLIVAGVLQATGGVAWVYWLLAMLLLPVLLWIAYLPSPPTRHLEQADGVREAINYRLLGMLVLFFFLFVGVEVSYSGWIFNYAVAMGLGTETAAAYLNSVFWIAFTIGRLIGIPISSRFRPRTILLTDLLGCILSVSIVLLWPHSAWVLWVGVAGAGLAMASIFAVTLSWAERRLHLTAFITSCFFIGTSTASMFFPWFIGQLFEASGPRVTMLTILIGDVAAFGVFLLLMVYGGAPRQEK
jgi:FHS family Na+ dependent glucose MFS transporter 1